jgi:hypothetical protein
MRRGLALFRAGHPGDFVERYGGFVVATALALVVHAWLFVTEYQRVVPLAAEPDPIKIVLESRPEPPPADAGFTEAVATSMNPVEDAAAAQAVLARAMELLERPPAPTVESWRPATPEENQRLERLREEVLDARDAMENRQTDLKGQINRLAVESAGREFLLNSDGGRAGIIRTIDVGDFPESVLVPVLGRYGITIEYRYVEPDPAARTFLNAAVTSEGTFTSTQQAGYAEVFVCSPKAVSMMATMETQAIMARGLDPGRTRVRSVTFGIVMDADGRHAMGVTNLETEQVR